MFFIVSDNLAIEKPLGRSFVFSLALALFGTSMLDVLSSLFLVDLAKTFFGSTSLVSIAIVSQIVTISSIAGVVFGVLNGFLSVKFQHKKLLLFGAACIVIGALGCFFAPSLLFMQIFYPFDGIGTIIVGSMAFTLIGESLPLEKRAKAIGLVTSGSIFSSALGFALAGYIAAFGGWRSYVLWYILPISLIALVLVYKVIPSTELKQQDYNDKRLFLSSFKEVLMNKSAAACLFGSMLITAAGIWSFFAATFWRKQFLMPVETVGLITLTVVLVYAVGSIIGGRIVDRSGRKRLVVTSWIARGVLIAAIVFMPNFWSALLMSCLATFVGGIAVTSAHSLNLEQAPKSRGTMMSLGGVFASAGASLGVAVGGLALSQSGFQLLGITFGCFGVVSAVVIYFLARDPSKA
jgi:DHA1 family bicyclomycin/chloramphenicol resistance-like MFS transporter